MTRSGDGTSLATARRHLSELSDQNCHRARTRRYRRMTCFETRRTLAASADPRTRTASPGCGLLPAHLIAAAGINPRVQRITPPATGRPPAMPDLFHLSQGSRLDGSERANLHSAADYAADRGIFFHAIGIPAAMCGVLAARVTGIVRSPSTRAPSAQRAVRRPARRGLPLAELGS